MVSPAAWPGRAAAVRVSASGCGSSGASRSFQIGGVDLAAHRQEQPAARLDEADAAPRPGARSARPRWPGRPRCSCASAPGGDVVGQGGHHRGAAVAGLAGRSPGSRPRPRASTVRASPLMTSTRRASRQLQAGQRRSSSGKSSPSMLDLDVVGAAARGQGVDERLLLAAAGRQSRRSSWLTTASSIFSVDPQRGAGLGREVGDLRLDRHRAGAQLGRRLGGHRDHRPVGPGARLGHVEQHHVGVALARRPGARRPSPPPADR